MSKPLQYLSSSIFCSSPCLRVNRIREDDDDDDDDDNDADQELIPTSSSSAHVSSNEASATPKRTIPTAAASRLRSLVGKARPAGLGRRVTGTVFGLRHGGGHVHLAFQPDPKSSSAVLIELTTPTDSFVADLAMGPVRFVLGCRKSYGARRVWEEEEWMEYCNGMVCGRARSSSTRSAVAQKVLEVLEPVSFGAGVIPGAVRGRGRGEEGDLMYVRARFERVVTSKDSEAFYIIDSAGNGNGHPEISIIMYRV